ncbi:Gfo/Idh/MocA family protein [Chloroflexota bacterium]
MIFRWAMIGTGNVNRRMAQSIQGAKDAELLAVLSRDKGKATTFAKEYGIERAYDSLDEMLRDPDINIVYVATPNILHAPHTIRVAEAGKHVLCEKPMATTVRQCHDMIEACQKHGVKLGIDFQYRYYPVQQKARELVASGVLGDIIFANAHVELPVRSMPDWYYQEMAGSGILYAVGAHRIDLLRFILGSEVEAVSAFVGEQTVDRPFEEIVVAILKFRSGAYANIHFSYHTPHGTHKLEVHGTNASLFGNSSSPLWAGTEPEGKLNLKSDTCSIDYQFQRIDVYKEVVEHFTRSIREGVEPLASGIDGLRAAEIAIAILESSREGKTIKLNA